MFFQNKLTCHSGKSANCKMNHDELKAQKQQSASNSRTIYSAQLELGGDSLLEALVLCYTISSAFKAVLEYFMLRRFKVRTCVHACLHRN